MIRDVERRRLYHLWRGMRNRCGLLTDPHYKDYGARGIAVCDRWRVFQNFVADMSPRPSGHSIDRIDNNGNYEPLNCRWVTQAEQTRNTRFNRRMKDGRLFRDVAKSLGVPIETVRHRVILGWPEHEVFAPAWEKKRAGSLKAMCVAAGMSYKTVWKRIKDGWRVEDALSEPIGQGRTR